MSGNTTFRVLMNDLIAGREEAAVAIVDQYTDALVAVAQNRLSSKLRRRIDPEDVVQSVYRSFFGRLREKKFQLGDGRDLWNLLVRMTLNKVCNKANHHRALKRSFDKEQTSPADSAAIPLENLARSTEPSPEEAMQLVETLEGVVSTLKPDQRSIFELRLQGYNTLEIARQTNRAERSVRRVLQQIRETLERMAVA